MNIQWENRQFSSRTGLVGVQIFFSLSYLMTVIVWKIMTKQIIEFEVNRRRLSCQGDDWQQPKLEHTILRFRTVMARFCSPEEYQSARKKETSLSRSWCLMEQIKSYGSIFQRQAWISSGVSVTLTSRAAAELIVRTISEISFGISVKDEFLRFHSINYTK